MNNARPVIVSCDAGATIVEVVGEVDLANVEQAEGALRAAIERADVAVVVDLSPTTYLDSAGIRLLFEAIRDSRRAGKSLSLVVPPASILRRTLDVVDLERFVPLYPSRDAARDDMATLSP